MKVDVTVTASFKMSEHHEKWRVPLVRGTTTYRTMSLPKGFKGWLAEKLGLPCHVTVEIAPAKKGRPSGTS